MTLLLLLSLLLLRWQLVLDLNLAPVTAIDSGLAIGVFYDVCAACLPAFGGALSTRLLARSARPVVAVAVGVVWLTSAANVLYFRFFGVPLDWWIVVQHWRDAAAVQGSARTLGLTAPIVASAGAAALAIAAALRTRQPGFHDHARRLRVASGLALAVLVAVGFSRMQAWLDLFGGARPLNDNVLRMWANEIANPQAYAGAGAKWLTDGAAGDSNFAMPSRALAAYRDFSDRDSTTRARSLSHRASDPLVPWPLVRTFVSKARASRALRRRLGLPDSGRVHVVVLFLESVRAFELQHRELGPVVFPRTTSVLAKHGIVFTQAYSSAFSAGQTVRGQFSTLCSMLPNMLGAATYIAHNAVRVHCVQEFLKAQGYRTNWMSAFRSTYHGKRAFETLHGTERFFDDAYFRSIGVTETIGDWGLADRPFLQGVAKLVDSLDRAGEATFANVLTISTHHPYSTTPDGPLPAALMAATGGHGDYQGYLSRLRYTDSAVGAFFDTLFASSAGDRTLVVLLGDHGSPVKPHAPLSPAQRHEMLFRIPLAFVAKAATPERIDYPVHQVDVTPTIAEIVGGRGPVNWVGRSAFAGEGSPWLYASGRTVSYRTRRTACYPGPSAPALSCFDVRGRDPLLDDVVPVIAEDTALTRFFGIVARANLFAIALDRVLPPATLGPARSSGLSTTR